MKLLRIPKSNCIKKYLSIPKQSVVFVYLFCMLGIFPLYFKDKYYEIGDAKFEFFWKLSLGFLGIYAIISLIKAILEVLIKDTHDKTKLKETTNTNHQQETNPLLMFLDNLSFLDYVVFIYGICVILSYAFSDFKDYALKGATGWNMGLCSQMIFIALYYILSRQQELFSGEILRNSKEKYPNNSKIPAMAINALSLF